MSQNNKKVFVSWSGGKEASLSCYRVMKNLNVESAYLLNMVSEDGTHSRSHGLGVEVLKAQADAIGVPIVQKRATWRDYEGEFKKALADFKKKGVEVGVFGDIDVQEHRDWVERVCEESEIKPLLPLWQGERRFLLEEFIDAGFKAIIVAVNLLFLGEEWLGREINKEFMDDLRKLSNVDLCGEKGEYHTFVYDGPFFKKPISFTIGKKIFTKTHGFLEIKIDSRFPRFRGDGNDN